MRVATTQLHHERGNKNANLQKMEGFVREAANNGVRLITFPEMCITGYWHVRNLSRDQIESLAEPIPAGPSTQRLLRWSDEHDITVGAGLIEEEEGTFYNSYVVAQPDGSIYCHRKLHTFISEHLASGDSYTVFQSVDGPTIGILTCYDNNLIENARITALKGAEILLAPHQTGGCDSGSPRAMGTIDPELWHNRADNPDALRKAFQGPKGRAWLMRWLPARAHDNGMFLLFSNGVGLDDGEVRTGNAMILDPYGEIIAESDHIEDDIVIGTLNLDELPTSSGRRWLSARRPELYDAITSPTGSEKDIRTVRFPE